MGRRSALCLCVAAWISSGGSPAPAHAAQASPRDWRDQLIYFIMTDRFSDGDPANNSANGTYAPADGSGIHGGDLQGIRDKLDYIQGLGATGIWITPAPKNRNAYHGYAAWELMTVDPKLGSMADLKALASDLHSRGMVLILDIVANHTADLIGTTSGVYTFQYPGTYTLQYHDNGVKHTPDTFATLNYFHAHGSISNFNDETQAQFGDFFGLDDFNTQDTGLRKALIELYAWWIRESDCDGFRVDTVKHVEMGFWQVFCPGIRQAAKDAGKDTFFLFGEAFDYTDSKVGSYTGKTSGDSFAFDSMLYFPMQGAIKSVFKEGAATQGLDQTYSGIGYYDTSSRDKLVTFLDNHDMARFLPASVASSYHSNLKIALTFMLTSTGVPVIYYGTEQGFDGGSDPYNREDMWDGQWDFGPSDGDNFNTSHELYCHVRQLAALRRDWSPLRRGAQKARWATTSGSGIYAFSRQDTSAGEVVIVLNTATSSKQALTDTTGIATTYPAGTKLYNLFDPTDVVTVGSGVADTNQISVTVPALSAKIYAPKDTPSVEACSSSSGKIKYPVTCLLESLGMPPPILAAARAFRDRILLESRVGRGIVGVYDSLAGLRLNRAVPRRPGQ